MSCVWLDVVVLDFFLRDGGRLFPLSMEKSCDGSIQDPDPGPISKVMKQSFDPTPGFRMFLGVKEGRCDLEVEVEEVWLGLDCLMWLKMSKSWEGILYCFGLGLG